MALLKTIGKRAWFEFKPIFTVCMAIILFCIITPFGLLWHFGKPFYDGWKKKKKFWPIVGDWFLYWLKLLYQFWVTIKYLINRVSIAIDIFGNVADGELLEDTVTSKEQTLFGDGKTTVSASIGDLSKQNKLDTKFGRFVDKTLSVVFEPNHSINAIDKKKLLEDWNTLRGIDRV
jgi:hypothetical protein